MKKVIIIILHFIAIFGILIAIGCIPEEEEVGRSEIFTGELERNVELKILENDIARELGYLDELLDAFNEEYAEYGITAVDADMSESSNLIEDGPYGYGPDVLYQANDNLMKYVDGKHILPIPVTQVDDYEGIAENAWAAYEKNDQIWGVPVNVQEPLLFYRKDLIPDNWETEWDDNQNGVPDMIESWPALYKFSEMLYNDGNPDTYGYMKSYEQPYFSMGYLYSYGGYIFGDNNNDTSDIGISAGDSYLGAMVVRQQATLMTKSAQDGSITSVAYTQLAKGNFFATATTPDVTNMFIEALKEEGLDPDECLGVSVLPQLPENGDLTDEDAELFDSVSMGGVHAYSISAYTKSPNACLAFINFATKWEMLELRNQILGVVPARTELSEELGGINSEVMEDLNTGYIYVMPSNSELSAVWNAVTTLFLDCAADAFRDEPTLNTKEAMKARVEQANQAVIDALKTLG